MRTYPGDSIELHDGQIARALSFHGGCSDSSRNLVCVLKAEKENPRCSNTQCTGIIFVSQHVYILHRLTS